MGRHRSLETQEPRNPRILKPALQGTVIELYLGLNFPSILMHGIFCLDPFRTASEGVAGFERIRPIEFTTILLFYFTLEILKAFII